MTDVAALLALLVVLALVLAFASKRPIDWIREELRLMRADTWQGEYLVNPALVDVERAALMAAKGRALGKRMKRQGRSLISKTPKPYVPVLTKQVDPVPPLADKVVPIRRVA
jgi:hypothetical protein